MRAAAGAAAAEREGDLRARRLCAGIQRRDEDEEPGGDAPARPQTFREKGVKRVSRS